MALASFTNSRSPTAAFAPADAPNGIVVALMMRSSFLFARMCIALHLCFCWVVVLYKNVWPRRCGQRQGGHDHSVRQLRHLQMEQRHCKGKTIKSAYEAPQVVVVDAVAGGCQW